MRVRVRFAPSPTGYLQVGNARIALINWLHARAHDGTFLLRLDDTDAARSDEACTAAIRADLDWLGLHWDDEVRQSDRLERYTAAAGRLREGGWLYPCYETPDELAEKRRAQEAKGKPPVYDRAALNLSADERAHLEAQGRRPHWRFKLAPETVSWTDRITGEQTFQAGSVSDPVLIREDGRPLYTLTSVVDDLELGITEVVRGADHLANTAAQIQLFRTLGGEPPRFAHLNLMTDASGRKLSKREADLSLQSLREREGIEAMALNSYLAKLGTPDPIDAHPDLDALIAGFDLGRFGRAAPKFDWDELVRLNARVLQLLPVEAVADRLRALGVRRVDAAFWEAVRGNLTGLSDARVWDAVCHDPIEPWIEEPEFVAEAAAHLPPEPWDDATWKAWTDAVKAATGRTGAKLFKPLRKALTGREHGPPMNALLPLIGRDAADARLHGRTA